MQTKGDRQLDKTAMCKALWLPLAFWSAAVILLALAGQPTVVCITPLAWLLAIPIGQQVIEHSRNCLADTSLVEAGICGGVLGIFQGLLFLLVGFIAPGMTAQDRQLLLVLALFSILIGLFACSATAVFFAMRSQNRLEEQQKRGH